MVEILVKHCSLYNKPGYRAVGSKSGRVRELAIQGAEELFVTLIAVKFYR